METGKSTQRLLYKWHKLGLPHYTANNGLKQRLRHKQVWNYVLCTLVTLPTDILCYVHVHVSGTTKCMYRAISSEAYHKNGVYIVSLLATYMYLLSWPGESQLQYGRDSAQVEESGVNIELCEWAGGGVQYDLWPSVNYQLTHLSSSPNLNLQYRQRSIHDSYTVRTVSLKAIIIQWNPL